MGTLDFDYIVTIQNRYRCLGKDISESHKHGDYYIAMKIKHNNSIQWKIIYIITENGILHMYPFENKVLGSYYKNQRLTYEEFLNHIEKNAHDYLGKKKKLFRY